MTRTDHIDRTSLVAGLAIVAIGTIVLLDRTSVLDLHWSALWPLLAGALGAILLTSGFESRRGAPEQPGAAPESASPAVDPEAETLIAPPPAA